MLVCDQCCVVSSVPLLAARTTCRCVLLRAAASWQCSHIAAHQPSSAFSLHAAYTNYARTLPLVCSVLSVCGLTSACASLACSHCQSVVSVCLPSFVCGSLCARISM